MRQTVVSRRWAAALAALVALGAAPSAPVIRIAAPALGAEIGRVSVTGHESVRTRDALEALGLAGGSEFDEGLVSAGVDSLLALLALAGRPFARVTAEWDSAGGEVAVRVTVDEGSDVRVGDLVFAAGGDTAGGLTGVPPGPRRLRPGAVLTGRTLKEGVLEVLEAYADGGRPFARVAMPPVVRLADDGSLSGTFAVSPGPAVEFGKVVIAGNVATRERVLIRETGIRRGEPYSRTRVSRVRARLERLGYLSAVSDPVVAVDPVTGEATVGVEVTEGRSSRIAGALGLARGPSGESELTGLIDVALGNIAGTGRSAAASWERIRENETEISFSYTEPWLLGAPIDVGVTGAQAVRDTLYTTTEGDLFVTARMGDRTRLTWSVGAERYVPGSDAESTTNALRTAFGAAYDGTDRPWNPTHGATVNGRIEYSTKENADTGAEESSGVATLEAWGFIRVRPRQVLALRARVEAMSSTEDDVPVHELLVLGGARSLRGYREEQFRGTRVALGTVEYRFHLGRKSRAHAFVDVGYWCREGANPAKDTKLGYGIGLRGETRLGTISIDYGLGEGDDLLDGKLHAGLIREF